MAYASQTDLETALGGARVLVQLLDKDGDGIADSARVTYVLSRADGEIKSRIAKAVDISALSAPYDDALVFAASEIAAYWSWRTGAEGQAIPVDVGSGYERAIQWCVDVGNRVFPLGSTTRRASAHHLTEVTKEATETMVHTDSPRMRFRHFW